VEASDGRHQIPSQLVDRAGATNGLGVDERAAEGIYASAD
jgi:hypothetical protein